MKIATKLTKKVAEFVNENRVNNECYEYSESEIFFHYPGIEIGWHESPLEVGYTPVSEQEFIDMVTAELFKEAQKPKEMKTKCIVLGQENEPVKEFKKIEFVHALTVDLEIERMSFKPNRYQNIELICKDYADGLDLMFAYEEDRHSKEIAVLVLGYWNDGIV